MVRLSQNDPRWFPATDDSRAAPMDETDAGYETKARNRERRALRATEPSADDNFHAAPRPISAKGPRRCRPEAFDRRASSTRENGA